MVLRNVGSLRWFGAYGLGSRPARTPHTDGSW